MNETLDIIQIAGLAGAILTILRLLWMVREAGANNQKLCSAIEELKRHTDSMSRKITALQEEVKEARLASAEAHGEIRERIAKLEAGGYAPAKAK